MDHSSASGAPIEITDGNIDSSVTLYDVIVIDCWAPWCGPCKMIAPIIEELAKSYKGKVVFGKVNTDDEKTMKISMKYGIRSIPTLLYFKKGQLVDKTVGLMPKAMIEEHLKALL